MLSIYETSYLAKLDRLSLILFIYQNETLFSHDNIGIALIPNSCYWSFVKLLPIDPYSVFFNN